MMQRERLSRTAALLGALLLAACGVDPGTPAPPSGPLLTTVQAGGVARKGKACSSSGDCQPGFRCTTEASVCDPPPGCRPGDVCAAVCFGTCVKGDEVCGQAVCPGGQVCCSQACGLCAPAGSCPPGPCECRTDADCREREVGCNGTCDCRAVSICQPDPRCDPPGVPCLVGACSLQTLVPACRLGQCLLQPPRESCAPEACGPALGLPTTLCPDGTHTSGPTGRCLRNADGTCSFEILACPDPSICTPASR
jgi:hypothetical protein